jgi:hypothetical protein
MNNISNMQNRNDDLPMNNMMNTNSSNNNTMHINAQMNPFLNNTMNINNQMPNNNNMNNNNNPILNSNLLFNSMQIPPNFNNLINSTLLPFPMNNIGFPNLNQNLNPQMNQNFNNFNFIGFHDYLNFRNDPFQRQNSRRESLSDLDFGSAHDLNVSFHSDDQYSKLKKQFIKELDEFQFKNKDKFDDSLVEEECSICLCKYKITDILKILPCKHPFHKKCIKKWLSNDEHNKCPLCNFDIKAEIMKKKTEFKGDIMVSNYDRIQEEEERTRRIGKKEDLEALIENREREDSQEESDEEDEY